MGFLQNDTNNIIVDAVLTDVGREFLSRNDGSFSIVKFSFGDDEVDYGIITKFGRTVGKEKIEKNTPVLEASTSGNFAQKYRTISLSNPNLLRLPNLTLTGPNVTNNILSLGRTTTKSSTLTVTQVIQNESTIDVELRDQAFLVEMNSLFLQVQGDTPDNVDGYNRATYILTRDAGESDVGGSTLTATVQVKAITNSQFTTYGSTQNKNVIRTFVRITGVQSGAVKEFEVQIDKTL
tara:strand:- start:2414 stop:3121 length:708 start_codon:yes stop_codon:yes gene_type:complete